MAIFFSKSTSVQNSKRLAYLALPSSPSLLLSLPPLSRICTRQEPSEAEISRTTCGRYYRLQGVVGSWDNMCVHQTSL